MGNRLHDYDITKRSQWDLFLIDWPWRMGIRTRAPIKASVDESLQPGMHKRVHEGIGLERWSLVIPIL